MLVITRKEGEALVVGETIHVKVLAVDGSRVRLGIEAPKEVTILRQEIVLEVQNENELAVQSFHPLIISEVQEALTQSKGF